MMDPRTYKVHCLEAKYDEPEGMLVLNCFFEELGEKKIVHFSKKDFNYHGNPVPDCEMHKTARLFRNKRFYLRVDDDPELDKMTEEEKMQYAVTFKKDLGKTFDKMTEDLLDPKKQIERRMERVLEREKKRRNEQ